MLFFASVYFSYDRKDVSLILVTLLDPKFKGIYRQS